MCTCVCVYMCDLQSNYYNVPMTSADDGRGARRAGAALRGSGEGGGGGGEEEEDYMNQDPEGLFHTYSNQRELLEQVKMRRWPR